MYRLYIYLAEMKAVFKLNGKESYEAITAPIKNAGIQLWHFQKRRQLVNFRFANGQ